MVLLHSTTGKLSFNVQDLMEMYHDTLKSESSFSQFKGFIESFVQFYLKLLANWPALPAIARPSGSL